MSKCIVFPGQGSQYLGMGKFLYDNFKVSKEIFEEVDNSLEFKLTEIIFGDDEKKLNLTENTQPAIMAVSIAAFKALESEKGLKVKDFKFCAGHSLGEYSALVFSQSLKLSDASKILKKRGRAMQNAVPVGEGGMAAILNCDVTDLQDLINELGDTSVEISNDNCPGQIVVSGKKTEVENFASNVKDKLKKKSIMLPVSAPFHCKMMIPAADELMEYIEQFEIKDPLIPFISNVSVSTVTNNQEIKDLLIKCVYSRVKWRECVEYFKKNNISYALECGPGKALTNMFKRFDFTINTKKTDTMEDLENYE